MENGVQLVLLGFCLCVGLFFQLTVLLLETSEKVGLLLLKSSPEMTAVQSVFQKSAGC